MGLFDFFKKSATKNKEDTVTNTNSNNECLDKLVDGELPWGWVSAYADFYGPRDAKLYELSSNASHAKNIDDERNCLITLIEFYEQYKEECIAKGECFYKYFSDMHMHCHNSRNPDFEFVAPSKERLSYINENYDSLIKEQQKNFANEKKKQTLLNDTDLNKAIKDIIINNPGILQSDVYKMFDSLLKDSVSEWLYFSAKNGKIKREKAGRTYQLFWIE